MNLGVYLYTLRQKGYLVVLNPFAKLTHYESKTRGMEDTKEKIQRFESEIDLFKEKWKRILEFGDPYFNINFRFFTKRRLSKATSVTFGYLSAIRLLITNNSRAVLVQ